MLRQARKQSGLGLGLEGVSADEPASQTLIVLSREPEMMVEPSGEKATEFTGPLCALCFGALADGRMCRLPLGRHPNSKRGACLHV